VVSPRAIKQFTVLAEELHFGRAAQRLGMSQPPLSQAMMRLEEELGVELLDRTGRKIGLTRAGHVFLDETRRLTEQQALAIDHTRAAHHGIRGTIALGFVGSVSYGLLPELLIKFRSAYPDISFELRELTSSEQLRDLEARRIEIGIIRLPLIGTDAFSMKAIKRERMIAVLPKDHVLSMRKTVSLTQLADETFIMFPPHRSLSLLAKTIMACHAAGFSPRVGPQAWQMSTMMSLVAAKAGIALLPAQVRNIPHPGVIYREVKGDDHHLDLEIALLWRRDNRSGLCQTVIDAIPAARHKASSS
jgi:DNA-binding transcriptional LysR family regulator